MSERVWRCVHGTLVSYLRPEIVSLGFRTPPVARFFRAGDPMEPVMADMITVEVWSGPAAPLPKPATGQEHERAVEDMWLEREWRRGRER